MTITKNNQQTMKLTRKESLELMKYFRRRWLNRRYSSLRHKSLVIFKPMRPSAEFMRENNYILSLTRKK